MMIEVVPRLPNGGGGPTHAFVILGRSRREAAGVEGAANHAFVILGRSKERSDAARPWDPCRYLAAVLLRTGTVAAGEARAVARFVLRHAAAEVVGDADVDRAALLVA